MRFYTTNLFESVAFKVFKKLTNTFRINKGNYNKVIGTRLVNRLGKGIACVGPPVVSQPTIDIMLPAFGW